jgi:UDP-2-acetamido-2-deoxy-ribo-hexuluronate aminotransferase
MDTLQCAVVLAKLKRLDWEIERRLQIGARYNALLDEAGIARVIQRPDRTSVFAQYTVLVDDRAGVQQRLKSAGIPTAVHYPIPLNRQPAYSNISGGGATPIADRAAQRVMSLPMHADLSDEHQDEIVAAVVEAVRAG